MLRSLLPLLAVLVLTVLAPLAGALLGGLSLTELLRLPLTERAWDPLRPNPLITLAAWLLVMAVIAAVIWFARPRAGPRRTVETRTPAPLPRYTWFGVFALIVAIAAVDGDAVNLATALITLAVTLFANADTQRRTGNSLLRQRPGYFFSLFPASLAVGWAFYWLNLWLQLWTYPPATETVPFVLGKSADYAVLLPALLSLRQWLASFPLLLSWSTQAKPLNGQASAQEGAILLGLATIALVGAALWPDWIYPLTLLAPLLLAIGLQQLRGQPTLFAGLANGDWSRVLLSAIAALLIGLLSQTCNQLLGAAWVFQLPLIGGPSLLGLPLPAWLWLPALGLFGLWVGDQLTAPWKQRPQQPQFRPRFPVKVVIEDLLGKPKRH
jgi:hypothetical protein